MALHSMARALCPWKFTPQSVVLRGTTGRMYDSGFHPRVALNADNAFLELRAYDTGLDRHQLNATLRERESHVLFPA